MFQVSFNRRTYRVEFQHARPKNGYAPNRGVTVCEIRSGQELAGWGVYSMDNLNKNHARKQAMKNALCDAGFERPDRRLFWGGYFHAHGRIE